MSGKSPINVLVYGWYHKGNLGDDLFVEAFHNLFPELNFLFTDKITKERLSKVDAVFFGGGSFLFSKPDMDPDLLPELEKKKIFYIGVGAETEIHPDHQRLIAIAKGVFVRSMPARKIINLNSETNFVPDIVYSLYNPSLVIKMQQLVAPIEQSVLVMPNISVVPVWNEEHWKHAAWTYFKSEFAQALDDIIDNGYKVTFLPMCVNQKQNDIAAAYEIASHMANRDKVSITNIFHEFSQISNEISKHQYVITQRYHGIVLSEMMHKRCISIHHHDKLKNTSSEIVKSIPYYGISKDDLLDSFYQIDIVNVNRLSNTLSQNNEFFIRMQEKVRNILHNG